MSKDEKENGIGLQNGDANSVDSLEKEMERNPSVTEAALKEDPAHKRARMRSIYIVQFGMFIISLGFSIIITGVYPYMEQILPTKAGQINENGESELLGLYGWVVAVNPLGQMIFAPLYGLLYNKMGTIRVVTLWSSVCYILGNVLYACLSGFPESARYGLLIFARFSVGAASGLASTMLAYVSQATYIHERTVQMSLLAAVQSLGFILGPGIQAALTPIKCSEPPEGQDTWIALDMFTVSGWFSAFLGCVIFVTFLPGSFNEYNVAKDEEGEIADKPQVVPAGPPNYWVAANCLFCYFLFLFNFVILETLGTPICLDQFGWKESYAILVLGIVLSCGGIISVVSFWSVGKLSQRYDERKLMMIVGIGLMIVARLLFLPIPGLDPPKHSEALDCDASEKSGFLLDIYHNETTSHNVDLLTQFMRTVGQVSADASARNVECGQGDGAAPLCAHLWCCNEPALTEYQFFAGMGVGMIGYPYCIALCQAIFSKVLGQRPQGLWMGLLMSSGSGARVLGPILVTYIYEELGLYVTTGFVVATLLLALVLNLAAYKYMVPMKMITIYPPGWDEKLGRVNKALVVSEKDPTNEKTTTL